MKGADESTKLSFLKSCPTFCPEVLVSSVQHHQVGNPVACQRKAFGIFWGIYSSTYMYVYVCR